MIAEITREDLRRDHRVRLVTTEEEGCALNRLPPGTYGWTYAPASESPLFSKQGFQSFEVHKAQDGTGYLVAYATDSDANALAGKERPIELKVYPETFEGATRLVCLRADGLRKRTHQPSREEGNPVQVSVIG